MVNQVKEHMVQFVWDWIREQIKRQLLKYIKKRDQMSLIKSKIYRDK